VELISLAKKIKRCKKRLLCHSFEVRYYVRSVKCVLFFLATVVGNIFRPDTYLEFCASYIRDPLRTAHVDAHEVCPLSYCDFNQILNSRQFSVKAFHTHNK
jgi:hypothetical protein